MGCPELAPLLSAMIDGELDLDIWQGIDQHLEQCERCRRELRHLRRSRRLYAAIPLLAPPAGWCYATMTGVATVEAVGLVAASAAVPVVTPAVGLGTTSGVSGILGVVGSFLSGKAAAVAVAASVTVATTMTPGANEQSIASAAQEATTPSAQRRWASSMDFAMSVPASEASDVAFTPVGTAGTSTSPLPEAAVEPADARLVHVVTPPVAEAQATSPSIESATMRTSDGSRAVRSAPADFEDRVAAARTSDGSTSPAPGNPVAATGAPHEAHADKQGGPDFPAGDTLPGQATKKEDNEKGDNGKDNNGKEKPHGGQADDPEYANGNGPPDHPNGPPEHANGPPGHANGPRSHANAAPKRQPPGQAVVHRPGGPAPAEKPAGGFPHESEGGPPEASDGPPGPAHHGPPDGPPGHSVGEPPEEPSSGPAIGNTSDAPGADHPGPGSASAGNESAGGPPAARSTAQTPVSGHQERTVESSIPAPPNPPAEKSAAGQPKPPAQESAPEAPKQSSRQNAPRPDRRSNPSRRRPRRPAHRSPRPTIRSRRRRTLRSPRRSLNRQ